MFNSRVRKQAIQDIATDIAPFVDKNGDSWNCCASQIVKRFKEIKHMNQELAF